MVEFIPPLVLEIVARSTGVGKGIDEAKAQIDELEDAPPINLTADPAGVTEGVVEAKSELDGLEVPRPIDLTADPAGVVAGVEESKASLDDLQAKAAETDAVTRDSTASTGSHFAGLGKIAKIATIAVGAGFAGAAYEGVKSSAAFGTSVTQLVTGAGEAQKNITMITQGILAMAPAVGQMPLALSQGLYLIESAGYHGAAGLNVLKAAAQGAAAGGAQTTDVANALTTALHDYAIPASHANQVTSALIETVALGKTHLGDLSRAFASVMPVASALGVKFSDVTGAMSTMTLSGMTAKRAGTDLAFLLRSFGDPAAAAQKAMGTVGISAQTLKDTLAHKGLRAALEYVQEMVGKKFPAGSVQATQAFSLIAGGATGYSTALMLTGKNQATFAANQAKIQATLAGQSRSVQGFGVVKKDAGFNFDQLKAQLSSSLVSLGSAIMPAITAMLPVVTKAITGLMSAIGPALKAVIPAITSLIPMITGALAQVMAAVGPILKAIMPVVTSALKTLGALIGPAIKDLLPLIGPVVKLFGALFGELSKIAGPILKDLGPVFKTLTHAMNTVFNSLEKSGAFQAFGKMLEKVAPPLANLVDSLINGLMPALTTIIPILAPILTAMGTVAAAVLGLGPMKGVIYGIVGAMIAWKAITLVQTAATVASTAAQVVAKLATIAWGLATKAAGLVQIAFDAILDANPFAMIVLAIMAVVAVVILVATHFKELEKIAEDVFKAVWHAIKEAFDWVVAHWPLLLDILLGPFGFVVGWVIKHFKGIKDEVKKVFDDVVHFLAGLPAALLKLVEGLFNAGVKVGEAIVEGIGHALTKLASVVLHAIESIPIIGKAVKIALSVGSSAVGGAVGWAEKHLAAGGIVVKPTLAMVGEGSEPEAVLPLSQLRQMLAGRPGDFYPSQGAGASTQQAKGGLTIENLSIVGRSRTDAEIVNELWLRLRPYLTAPAY